LLVWVIRSLGEAIFSSRTSLNDGIVFAANSFYDQDHSRAPIAQAAGHQ